VLSIYVILGSLPFVGRYLKDLRYQRRLLQIDTVLPEAIDSLTTSLKAGVPLPTALETIRKNYPGPLGREFENILMNYKLGVPLVDAITDFKKRIPTESVVMFSAALGLAQRLGGNTTEILMRLSTMLREKHRVGLKLKALTAQGRAQAVILCLTPPGLFIATAVIDPTKFQLFTSTTIGQGLLALAIILEALGIYSTRRIMRVLI
jgi:tight adherence protein B